MNMQDWIISPEELQKKLGKVVLVDVREPEENAELRIEGSRLIPLGEISQRASELDPKADTVIYCAHGMRSMQALMALRMLGYENLWSLDGGISAWEEQGLPCQR